MLSTTHSCALSGVEAIEITIEVNCGERGEPRFIIVGLPDAAVKESHDRVFSALANSGFGTPKTRTTVNLAPGNIKKEGPRYDLPIALGVIASSGQAKFPNANDYIIAGELSLSGKISHVNGGIALARYAKKTNKKLIVPQSTATEASLVDGVEVFAIESLEQAVQFLCGNMNLDPIKNQLEHFINKAANNLPDFSDVKGQQSLRRAIEVAVAGGHNILMIGSPGSGKSMVAKRIPSIMTQPTTDEFLEILSIYSAAGMSIITENNGFSRPFRCPHHTISDVGLLGGGAIPKPGEISLAHNGVLFLDELPEFHRSTLEVLRQPLEDNEVSISRSAGKITLPCSIMLVAAMNPCPCGYLGDKKHPCRCSTTAIERYRSKISGPLLDRIDIHVDVPSISINDIRSDSKCESSETIRLRIEAARKIQIDRLKNGSKHVTNAKMSQSELEKFCHLTKEAGNILQKAMEQLSLSARAYDKILKVSRTISDLDQSNDIQIQHLLEAIQYRSLDRKFF